jgi:uncharacterized protein involved in exopolysaccharide biosynthesis
MSYNEYSPNGPDHPQSPTSSVAITDTVNLLDYLEVIVNNRWFIIKVTGAVAIISVLISLCLPNTYKSTARILPPPQELDMMGALLGGGSGIPKGAASGIAADLLGKGTQSDMYVGILTSEAMGDTIIDRFKLLEVYKKKYRVIAYEALNKHVSVVAGKKDGIISISVEDKNPNLAAEMANAYVEELGKLLAKISISGAGLTRSFLSERLAKARSELVVAEDAFKSFQTKNKIYSVAGQAQTTIVGIAQLRAQLVLQEVQLSSLRQNFTDVSSEIKNIKASISSLKDQISVLENSVSGGSTHGIGILPELEQQYIRLMREYKIHETIVELLTKQYEIAKNNETKNYSNLQIIQTARVSDAKYKPKRALIVLASTFVACCLAIFYTFMLEIGTSLSIEDRKRLHAIRRTLIYDNYLWKLFKKN